MRAVVQRVLHASVSVGGEVHSAIGRGLLVLLGIAPADDAREIEWMSRKLANLRIFDDASGKMNLPVTGIAGQIMVVSQFTLYADVSRGTRPGFSGSASHEAARAVYARFVDALQAELGRPVPTGCFGESMQVSLVNDGPVTLIIDTPSKA
jgi:D-tyrosyl-tRNA(Tyr) deacylase